MHCIREEFRAAKGQVYVAAEALSKLSPPRLPDKDGKINEIALGSSGGTAFTESKDINNVPGLGESIFGSNRGRPGLNRFGTDLHRVTTLAADQMMVMPFAGARTIEIFTFWGLQGICLITTDEIRQRSINRSEANGGASGFEI